MKFTPYPFLLFLLMSSAALMQAQKPNNFQNIQLAKLIKHYDLSREDIANAVMTSSHISRTSNVQHYYFRQTYQGIQINGATASIHVLPNGNLLKANSNFIKNPRQYIRSSADPEISAKSAIEFAATQLGYTIVEPLDVLSENTTEVDQQALFSKGGISLEDIPVHLMYQPLLDGSLRLAWDLSIDEIGGANWWSLRIDAETGELLHKNSWTVSCNLAHNHQHDKPCNHNNTNTNNTLHWMPINLVGGYNVYAMPVESPNHGGRTLVTDPDDPIASPYGWHDTNGAAGAEFNITRGNNAHAYEDGDNSGYSPNGGTALTFDYPINTTYSQANQSEDAAITNLFYWTNLCHDLWYQYGFDEASGNFQENNYGNGGNDGDYCRSEAQDGSGTCNANMSTPTDGNLPRMQMYVCNSRDGDLDNGVIVHEYGHGISTRLTGGGGNSGCLSNQEQMGEGWSDWFGMVMTIETGDAGTDSRGMGTWLFGENANGAGIRSHPYSTSLTINPHTYDDIKTESVPHGVGSVWCAMIWEVAWSLIDEHGFDPDFYTGTGGNNIAMALVTEGLKLQPCNPGFVDGRDAIIAADLALYGGANECLLWEAFAKRGLGFSADQGSSGSRGDGTEAFDMPPVCLYPALSFTTAVINTFEGASPETASPTGDCRPYTDHEIKVSLSSDPSNPASISILPSGSANSDDFELIGSDMTFPTGGDQTATLRIYNDATIEPLEDLQLDLVINNSGNTNADLGSISTLNVTIANDDAVPGSLTEFVLSNAGFESGEDGYTSTNPDGGDAFAVGSSADAGSSNWDVPTPLDGSSQLFYANDDGCNCAMEDVNLISPPLDLSILSNTILKYDIFFEERTYQSITESAELLISTDGGNSFSSLGNIPGQTGSWREETVDLSAYDGMNNVVIAFNYSDGTGWLYGIAIDHIRVEGQIPSNPSIATELSFTDKQDVPPNAEVYFYDENDNLMAGIQNGSNDLGCVEVTIDRAGTGTTEFWDNFPEHNLANKTFLFTPEFNSPNTSYTVTLYFTEEEALTWENETGKTWATNANIVKHATAISDVTPQNPYPNGQGSIEQAVEQAGTTSFSNAYYVTANFNTGFSGMGVGEPGSEPLPVELLAFRGTHIANTGNQLYWSTATETDNDYFEVQRSTDGRNFEPIGNLKGKGTSTLVNEYEFLDKVTTAETYYYRLKQVDFDSKFELSATIVIKVAGDKNEVQVYPNPTKTGINISLTEKGSEATDLVLYNNIGKRVLQQTVNINEGNSYYLELNDFPKGVYYGTLNNKGELMRFRFVKE